MAEIPDPALGRWDGDWWVEANGYRVSRYWCDALPGYYGPLRKDPDNGQGHIEFPNRVNEIIAKVTGVTGVLDCASEIHALETGVFIGYLYLHTRSDVPPVPIFWCTGSNSDNDGHYFMTGLIAGRGGRKVEEAAPSQKTYAAIFTGGAVAGNIPQLLKLAGIDLGVP